MDTKLCPNCGAEIKVNERMQISAKCPYCGVSLDLTTQTDKESGKLQRIVPFKISEKEATEVLMSQLVDCDGVPTDVFSHFKIESIQKFILPMYMYNGSINASWAATAVYEKSRTKRDSSGYEYTEYYKDYAPISGVAHGTFWIMSCANWKSPLPSLVRDYVKTIKYTNRHASASISREVGDFNYEMPEGCTEVVEDADSQTVFQSDAVTNHLTDLGKTIAESQVPGRYQDFSCSSQWGIDKTVRHNRHRRGLAHSLPNHQTMP